MELLPGWPLMAVNADFTQGPPGLPSFSAKSLNSGSLGVDEFTTSRGRQYELGYAEAGTAKLRINDPQELLNPANTGSPFATGGNQLVPYRALQIGAWWNAASGDVTGNLLNSANYPPGSQFAYDPSFESSLAWVGALSGPPTYALSNAQAFDGTQSLEITYNTGTDTAAWGIGTVPGVTYTVSLYVRVPAASSVTATLMDFPGGAGTTLATATSTTTGMWERLTVSGEALGAVSAVELALTTGTAPVVVYLDAVQCELGDTASLFTTAGPRFYAVHTGYIERYPQEWRDQGMWGMKPLESVDALSVLSRTVIRQSYRDLVLADGPNAYMPLDDESFPQQVIRPKGGARFIGYRQLGNPGGSVSFRGDTFLDGSSAVSVVQENDDPPTSQVNARTTYLGTRQGALTLNPQSFAMEAWIKFSAGTPYILAAVPSNTQGAIFGPTSGYIGWYTTGGQLVFRYVTPGGTVPIYVAPAGGYYPDGEWHHLVYSFLGNDMRQLAFDGQPGPVVSFPSTPAPMQLSNFFIDSTVYFGGPITEVAVANWATYGHPLTVDQIAAHYQRGIGYRGELTGDRATRLLDQYWQGLYVVTDTGVVPMSPDFGYDGGTMLDALQEISDTESGLNYVTGDGTVTVEARDTRYRQQTAQWVFGERADLGELPYTDVSYDYDPTYLYSEVQAQVPEGDVISVINEDALADYGQRILSKTLAADGDWWAEQYAIAYAARYGSPRLRVSSITIEPSSNPALWAAALGIEVSHRVTVNRRTGGGTVISGDYWVENVQHSSVTGRDSKRWTVTLQLSPVFADNAWILGDPTYGVLGSTTTCVY